MSSGDAGGVVREAASGLPLYEPVIDPGTEPFWEATARNQLVLPRCARCESWIWYPRPFCPVCGSREVTWQQAGGEGAVYSVTVVRSGHGRYGRVVPYIVAYVELDEGVRMLTNISAPNLEEVVIGARVRVSFDIAEGGSGLPRFVLEAPSGAIPGAARAVTTEVG